MNPQSNAGLELDRLTRRYPAAGGRRVPAVSEVNLSLKPGELLSLVGPSGSGKTTLLRLVAGLEQPDEGTVRWNGQNLALVPLADRGVAMVFQNLALYPHYTVRENLGLGLRIRKMAGNEVNRRVGEMAERLGLMPCLDRLPETLSGGERQRVALGRALMQRPRVLLLDEPLSDLDGPLRHRLRQEIRELQRALAVTMIHVTHDAVEAMIMGDRLAVLYQGKLEQVGAPRMVYDDPATRRAAEFLSALPLNIFRGTFTCQHGRGEFRSETSERWVVEMATSPADVVRSPLAVEMIVRPEAVVLSRDSVGVREMEGKVTAIDDYGQGGLVSLRVEAELWKAWVSLGTWPAVASTVRLAVPADHLWLFDAATGVRIRSAQAIEVEGMMPATA